MNFQVRSPKWVSEDHSLVALDAIVPWLPGEWIPMIVSAEYDLEYGRDLFSMAAAGDFGAVAEYVPPPVVRVPDSVERAQFKLALVELGLFEQAQSLVDASNDPALKISWAERANFERSNPMIAQMAAAMAKTQADIDAVFVLAKTK